VEKLTIVTAYYNRKQQFIETLKSIIRTKHINFEIIVVDDCSDEEQRIEDLIQQFPFIKVIRLEPENKWYVNPCIPFNIGIRAVSEDTKIIVLQNPECLHVGDILSYFNDNINDENYISISMYYLNDELTKILPLYNNNNTTDVFLKTLPIKDWQNHSIYKPVFYHFCSAISRSNMLKLNGFDEAFANGICIEDCDFVTRIQKLGLYLKIEDKLSVIHQYHDSIFYTRDDFKKLFDINKNIYHGKNNEKQ